MKNKITICSVFTLIVVSLMVLSPSLASTKEYQVTDVSEKHFRGWLVEFRKDAEHAGIGNKTIYQFFKNAKFLPRVIELDRSQPYKTLSFKQYVQKIIPDYKIKKAKKKLKENRKLLNEVSKKYNVQPRFIVALWAMESDFGNNQGGFSIVNSLATLAYEGRRAEFFKKELINALKIIDEGHIDFHDMKGSWAGAMGQTQFMPSSFLELAVDHDNDGRRDIWGTKEDVFGSIANYLSRRGWDGNTTWGREVKLPAKFDKSLIDKNIEKSLKQWSSLGVRKNNGRRLPKRADLKASLVMPEDEKGKVYLIYSNYKTVLKWNRSLYFATAVGLLSDGIQKQ